MNEQLEIIFWGVRGSTPCADDKYMEFGGNTMCVEIKQPGNEELLILDSGTGIRNLGNNLISNGEALSGHLFLTHPHWDHLQGFPFFKPIYKKQTSLSVHLPEQPEGTCRDILAGQMTDTYFPVTPEMLQANIDYITQTGELQDYGDFQVEFILANHHTNTAIYRFCIEDKIIVFAPDNEVPPQNGIKPDYLEIFTEFIKNADLLIHDGQYDNRSYEDKKNWGHSSWEEVVKVVRKVGVPNLILTHHDPEADDKNLKHRSERLEKQYGNDFDTVQLAREELSFKF